MNEAPKKILYIEDDGPSRLLVKKVLNHPPFEVFEAATGMEGLQKARQVIPDLILMDFNLPDISGPELASKIKSLSLLKDTVIVALTGTTASGAREMALIAGCDGYLAKPIDIQAFPGQIREFLKGKRETIDEEKQDYFRKKFQLSLVEHLTDKVKQLKETNRLLSERTARLKQYSLKQEILLNIINELQVCTSPTALVEKLVEEIWEKFQFDRCAYLEVDHGDLELKVAHARGFARQSWQNFSVQFDESLSTSLFREKHILLFSSPDKIPNLRIKSALRSIAANHFILGILGIPYLHERQRFAGENVDVLLSGIIPQLHDQTDEDVEMIREHLREYFSSEIFYFSGYLYIDCQESGKKIARYDTRILEMLLRTASLLYQNLLLREQLKEFFIRAEKEAVTDHLTGLYNYRYFRQQLSREFNRVRRHQTRFALLMLDIDHFKSYNDTFGHQAGDIVLKSLASLLLENTRQSDIVARYGGEEFVIISPELNREEGKKIAEKLCRIVANHPFPREALLPQKKVTVSIGVAVCPDDAQTLQELIRRADGALYRAKKRGRNRVQLFRDGRYKEVKGKR